MTIVDFVYRAKLNDWINKKFSPKRERESGIKNILYRQVKESF